MSAVAFGTVNAVHDDTTDVSTGWSWTVASTSGGWSVDGNNLVNNPSLAAQGYLTIVLDPTKFNPSVGTAPVCLVAPAGQNQRYSLWKVQDYAGYTNGFRNGYSLGFETYATAYSTYSAGTLTVNSLSAAEGSWYKSGGVYLVPVPNSFSFICVQPNGSGGS